MLVNKWVEFSWIVSVMNRVSSKSRLPVDSSGRRRWWRVTPSSTSWSFVFPTVKHRSLLCLTSYHLVSCFDHQWCFHFLFSLSAEQRVSYAGHAPSAGSQPVNGAPSRSRRSDPVPVETAHPRCLSRTLTHTVFVLFVWWDRFTPFPHVVQYSSGPPSLIPLTYPQRIAVSFSTTAAKHPKVLLNQTLFTKDTIIHSVWVLLFFQLYHLCLTSGATLFCYLIIIFKEMKWKFRVPCTTFPLQGV